MPIIDFFFFALRFYIAPYQLSIILNTNRSDDAEYRSVRFEAHNNFNFSIFSQLYLFLLCVALQIIDITLIEAFNYTFA